MLFHRPLFSFTYLLTYTFLIVAMIAQIFTLIVELVNFSKISGKGRWKGRNGNKVTAKAKVRKR